MESKTTFQGSEIGRGGSYRPDIDGLRAVAVLAVLFYHAGLSFPGGYVGVDVFFVISGFLITSISVRRLKDGSFTYLDFWKRRVRRLVPAVFVSSLFTAFMGYLLLLPAQLKDLGGALVSQPLMMANVYFWRVVKKGYFGDLPDVRPLLHTWSLGIEEQFYLVFPFFLLILWNSKRLRGRLVPIICLWTLASFGLCCYLTPLKSVASFFTLPTSAWELLLGSLLALAPLPASRLRGFLSVVGALLIGYSIFFFSDDTVFPGHAALVPCAGAALLIWTNTSDEQTSLGRLLSVSPMLKVGLASYSVYLWHWPIMAFASYTGNSRSFGERIAWLLLSLAIGFLSWRYIEVPTRRHRVLQPGKNVLVCLFLYVSVMICIGLYFFLTNGLPGNWDERSLSSRLTGRELCSLLHETSPFRGPDSLKVIGSNSSGTASFILWGDSHAMSLAPVFDKLGKDYGVKGVMLTKSSVPPLVVWSGSSKSVNFKQAWSELLDATLMKHQPDAIFLHGHWALHFSDTFERDLLTTLQRLEESGVRVYLVKSVPYVEGSLRHAPFRFEPLSKRWPLLRFGAATTKVEREESYSTRNAPLERALLKLPRELTPVLLDPSKELLVQTSLNPGGLPLYRDGSHLTDYGAFSLERIFERPFQEICE